MKLGLILSNDWELFGDGAGDYWRVQRRPLEQLLDCSERHGAKLTIMAEVGQQFAHRELGRTHRWAKEIADDWEHALQNAVCRGADVQMHLHPQWQGASHVGGAWVLDRTRDAFGSLAAPQMRRVLLRGKSYLESLLQPVDADYRCTLFRAGGYCIEPSGAAIAELSAAGFAADSSVVKGLVQPGLFDYRDAHAHLGAWRAAAHSVKHANPGGGLGLVELPVCSWPRWRFRLWERMRRAATPRAAHDAGAAWKQTRRATIERRYAAKRRGLAYWLRRPWKLLADRDVLQLDYDDLSAGEFVGVLRKILASVPLGRQCVGETLPVMAIGHVKTMHSTENLERILDLIACSLPGQVEYLTATQALRSILSSKARASSLPLRSA